MRVTVKPLSGGAGAAGPRKKYVFSLFFASFAGKKE